METDKAVTTFANRTSGYMRVFLSDYGKSKKELTTTQKDADKTRDAVAKISLKSRKKTLKKNSLTKKEAGKAVEDAEKEIARADKKASTIYDKSDKAFNSANVKSYNEMRSSIIDELDKLGETLGVK